MTGRVVRWTLSDRVATVTLDDPTRPVNTMNENFIHDIGVVLDEIAARLDEISGIVLMSSKSTFFAGGDLWELYATTVADKERLAAANRRVKVQLRRLETIGVPVVAAIGGAALGGGLEVALAAHARVAVDAPAVKLGLPEVTLGLLPGAGGVVRTVRLLGVEKALQTLLLDGIPLPARAAADLGLVDVLVGSSDELLPAARAWIEANPRGVQPYDLPGARIPGGTPQGELATRLPSLTASLRERTAGAPVPAPRAILSTAVESTQVDIDSAMEIETRYFVDVVTGQVAKNMMKGRFFDPRSLRRTAMTRESRPIARALVLGAGMMGSGIAHACARAGIDVVLKDIDQNAAQRGRDAVAKMVRRSIDRGSHDTAFGEAVLARIHPRADLTDIGQVDLIIEAVTENPVIKASVLAEAAETLTPGGIIATNTSSLPISELAENVPDAGHFIGLHFFSPVDRMPVVEVIKGHKTSDETLHRALHIVRQLGKTAVVVNDRRGFFTSRVIGTALNEAIAMLGEGIPSASIERAALRAGYPVPMLQLQDELTLTLNRLIRRSTQDAAVAAGQTWDPHPAEAVIDRMLDEFDRPGRVGGAGFYDYRDGRRIGLWAGLATAFDTRTPTFGSSDEPPGLDEIVDRLLFIEAIESARCLDEGVVETVADANVGSLLAIGFPPWTGGALQYIAGYPGGTTAFVNRARSFAARHGSRFEPPASLTASGADNLFAHDDIR